MDECDDDELTVAVASTPPAMPPAIKDTAGDTFPRFDVAF